MSQHRAFRCLVVLLIFFGSWSSFGAEEDESISLHHGVSAKPVKRTAPHYPRSELKRRQQGWVQLSYVVTEDGEIVDPIVENSSGSSNFERAALRTVTKWSYEPATWDGKPVQQCHTSVMITFALEGAETKVSRKFRNRYRKIGKAIDTGDLPKAEQLIDDVLQEMNLSISETTWLWALRARLAGRNGDKDAQLAALKSATRGGGRWADEKLYPRLLFVRTALEFETGNYSEALSNHDKLVEMKDDDFQIDNSQIDHKQIEHLDNAANTVRELLASEKVLSIRARIGKEEDCSDCATNWHYRPLRRKLGLADVDGSLRNIEFRCPWQRFVDKASEGATWDLPEDWGKCSIIVFGEPGTTFSLLELPST